MGQLDTTFALPWVEVAANKQAAIDFRDEQTTKIPQLKQDVVKYADAAWNARLARAYARAGEASYLLQDYEEAKSQCTRACKLFRDWDKTNAAFLNQLRVIRARCQVGEATDTLAWYHDLFEQPSKQLTIYTDWIDIGYVECLVANDQPQQALHRYMHFLERWRQRPNLELGPYLQARDMLKSLANSAP